MPTNPKLAAALWYAKRGWPVFAAHTPTRSGCSCAKKHRCPDIGKHPRWDRKLLPHGVHSATTDAAQIRRWWRKWPDANIGVATGTASGLIVLDVDPRNGGLESLETLQVTHERLSDTVQAITGGGGNHFVLEHPGPPTHIRNSSGELATGLDIKGDGGYIIAPPSLHVSGKPYEWKAGHSPKDLAPAKPPPWLLALVTKPAPRQEPPAPDQPIPEGQRNSTLFKNGCAMRRRGLGYDAILAALRVENAKRCKPPLDDKDVEKIADRAAKYQPADPNTRDVQDKDATLDEALTKAQEILVALQQTPDVRLVYQALGILCALPAEEWGPFKSEYKAILGNRLNLRDLDRAFKEAKYRQSQVRQTARESTDASDARKRVQINDRQLPDITADALSTVTTLYHQTPTHPQIYVRSGTLQRLVTDEDGRPILELLTEAPLRGILARAAVWYSEQVSPIGGVIEEDEFPPPEVVKDVLSLGTWPTFPAIQGVVNAPVFGTDGTLHQAPGYNPTTRLYQAGTVRLGDITPTVTNIEAAKQLLLNTWWADFPFRDDASKAHALAVVITSFVREMIRGQVPITLFDSPTPGTGKGLLADICAMPATGSPLPTMTAGRDADEWRKRITASLIKGGMFIGIDNLNAPLDSGELASVLTQPIWEDRVLGVSRNVTIPVKTIWLATGNNIAPSEEIARRSVWVRLDANVEKPWEREGFAIEKLRTWTLAHRAELVTAIITLIQAWIAQGKPPFTGRRKGSYEEWAEVVGGVLNAVDIPGFLGNETELFRTTVGVSTLLAEFVRDWWELYTDTPVGTDKLFMLASYPDDASHDGVMWKNLLAELLGSGNERSRRTKLGKLLNTHSDKVIVGYKIERDTVIRGIPHYKLKALQPSHRPPHIPTNGSGPLLDSRNSINSAASTQTGGQEINGEQNKGGERGEDGERSDYAHTRVLVNDTSTSDFYIERGGKPSPRSPRSPLASSSILADTAPNVRFSESEFDAPHTVIITEPHQMAAALPALLAAPALSLDTETTGLNPRTDRLRCVQFFRPDTAYVIDVFTVPVAMLRPIFDQPRRWIGHNLKFDFKYLVAAGLPCPTGEVVDTMLLSQLMSAGVAPVLKHSLDEVVQRELGITLDKTLQRSDWSQSLSREQIQYAARDVAVLWPLADALMAQIDDADLDRVREIEGKCLNALVEMELTGMPVDVPVWSQLTQAEEAKLPLLINEMAGLLNGEVHDLFGDCLMNWDSPDQVLSLLRARGHAVDNTDADTLKSLHAKDPLIPLLLAYREAAKRVHTYGSRWLEYVDTATQRVYPDYFQLGSRAGRMSCSKPNIQQIPRASAYRRAITAPEGRVLVKADYSQIELRIAAAIAKDAHMLHAFHAGKDLHTVTASLVLGIPEDQVTTDHRQIAKSLNFGLLYGMGAKGLQEYAASTFGVTLSSSEAAKHRRRFFQAYRGLQAWHDRTSERLAAETAMNTRTLAGRRRQQVSKFTECLNTPVQGSGADGLKLALGRLFDRRDEAPTAALVGVVHDEVVAECPADDAERTAAWLQRHMTAAMQELVGDTVPVVVDVHHGRTWGG